MKYLPRIVDSILDVRLRAVGATVIVGPKWCGKTTTAKQKAKSVIEMQDPDLQEGYLSNWLRQGRPCCLRALTLV